MRHLKWLIDLVFSLVAFSSHLWAVWTPRSQASFLQWPAWRPRRRVGRWRPERSSLQSPEGGRTPAPSASTSSCTGTRCCTWDRSGHSQKNGIFPHYMFFLLWLTCSRGSSSWSWAAPSARQRWRSVACSTCGQKRKIAKLQQLDPSPYLSIRMSGGAPRSFHSPLGT